MLRLKRLKRPEVRLEVISKFKAPPNCTFPPFILIEVKLLFPLIRKVVVEPSARVSPFEKVRAPTPTVSEP